VAEEVRAICSQDKDDRDSGPGRLLLFALITLLLLLSCGSVSLAAPHYQPEPVTGFGLEELNPE
jgi:hypothetical protein